MNLTSLIESWLTEYWFALSCSSSLLLKKRFYSINWFFKSDSKSLRTDGSNGAAAFGVGGFGAMAKFGIFTFGFWFFIMSCKKVNLS
jgi:hypothetical protein